MECRFLEGHTACQATMGCQDVAAKVNVLVETWLETAARVHSYIEKQELPTSAQGVGGQAGDGGNAQGDHGDGTEGGGKAVEMEAWRTREIIVAVEDRVM